jgi:hypothetical protein
VGDQSRLLCCSQYNGGVLYLENVQILGQRIVLFTGNSTDKDEFRRRKNLDGSTSGYYTVNAMGVAELPRIMSIVRRKSKDFHMSVVHKAQPFSAASCRSYFNGTLHVTGRLTTHNLYHASKINYLPSFAY